MSTQEADTSAVVVIGLEVHVQLETDTKIFCGCPTEPAPEPNSTVCPVCLGLPGALPVLNRAAVEAAVRVAKALDADIPEETTFHRKNYYYPDLPKGFQITQYDAPLCRDGRLEFDVDDARRTVRIRRAHLEEDPGSLKHVGGSIDTADYTLVDYNRAGTPLMEIVTAPDLRSPREARAFLRKLEGVLEYLGVFDATRDGSLRVDANISLVPSEELDADDAVGPDALEAANRTEVKNISSHKGAQQALAYEISRQRNALQHDRGVEQETRHWDEDKGITLSMRAKEAEKDYRYFREADLPPLRVAHWRDELDIPELPEARRERFESEYGLNSEVASKLTSTKQVADFFEAVASDHDPEFAATWVADELLGELNYRDMDIAAVEDRLDEFRVLFDLVEAEEITHKNAREVVLRAMLDDGRAPRAVIEEAGLGKSDDEEVERAVRAAIEDNPDAVADYHDGDTGAVNYLVGQVMQATGGRADPGDVNELLRRRLDE